MLKWSEPKGPPPIWLDPALEVLHDDPKMPKDQFAVRCMNTLLGLGCDVFRTAGVTANALNESAWGQSYRAWNLGGWKCTRAAANEHLARYGKGISWWRAPGNKAPGATLEDYKGGDPPWCFYRAFGSLDEFLGEWLEHFVPKPTDPAPYTGYRHCGELFWSGKDWFPELCRVGYKGTNTKKHPDGAIAEHESLCKSALTRFAQDRLGVTVDGAWGPKSKAACAMWQGQHGLPTTGDPDAVTLVALSRH